jgi:UDP-N-acetylmuramoyl-tripeptide--D-alanyl-D-alanine ligase
MSAPLWTSAEAAAATGGTSARDWRATGVSIDSRTVKAGDLFVALAGPNFDGHEFIAAAIAAGAAAAVASRRPAALPAEAPLLMVPDTMLALEALGRAARTRSAARFAAITGSVGKTGTKEALRLVLSTDGPTAASEGNLNNQWGAPLSLARMPREARYGVFELGMNHAGEIAPLTRLVRPHVAVITTVEPAHLEFFPSVEAIADAKAEIFLGVERGGAAVLNRDNPRYERLAAAARKAAIARIVPFGEDPRSEARLLSCRLEAEASAVEAEILGARVSYRIPLPGRHIVQNSLAVLAAAALLGMDAQVAASALAGLPPMKGRGARLTIETAQGPLALIDESYNASPAAMRAAIAVLGRIPAGKGGRRIAVLGDMRELGVDADRLHAELATALAAAGVDLLFCCGPHMRALAEAAAGRLPVQHAADSAALTPVVARAVRAGDVVLVKGSLGSRMAPIVDAIKGMGRGATRAANGS